MNNKQFKEKIHQVIPGGAHTYSKGDDQFPSNAPPSISKGKGAWVWDLEDNRFLDCSMGLGSVSLGHAFDPVLDAVKKQLDKGVNFQRPADIELAAAEKFLSLVRVHDMVKFAKNGSTVTTAAVKLARAFTGRKLVAFPGDHPFYSYDDWFIGRTQCNAGVPDEFTQLSVTFKSCDINSLKELFKSYPNQIACVMTEPEKNFCGVDCSCTKKPAEFLKEAIELCHQNGALFIMDEMVTGFKTGFPGSFSKYGLNPDMATWGKGIANGFAFCALTGKKEIMELGGIQAKGKEKVFLISTTHGGETHALAANMATIEFFTANNVLESNHRKGAEVINRTRAAINKHGLSNYIRVSSSEWAPAFQFMNSKSEVDNGFRTLFLQEMIAKGVLFQGVFVPTFSHQQTEIDFFVEKFDASLEVYKNALTKGYHAYLNGEPTLPVFRKII
jgi:glutamate-1-semialdehyde 2,1-aminomutase